MKRYKVISLLVIVTGIFLESCSSKRIVPQNLKNVLPNEEGIPIPIASQFLPNMIYALNTNFHQIVDASIQAQAMGTNDPSVELNCEAYSDHETRCALELKSTAIKLEAVDLMFGIMNGAVFLRRGCEIGDCDVPTTKIFWRTLEEQLPDGNQEYTLEVCNIEGVQVGLGFSGPLDYLAKGVGGFVQGPNINGFKIKSQSFQSVLAAYDAHGTPMGTEAETTYKTTAAFAGIGPVGGFPNRNCELSKSSIRTERDDDEFRDEKKVEEYRGRLPSSTYEAISGSIVRYADLASKDIHRSASGQAMNLAFSCEVYLDQDFCQLSYKGPSLSIPLPKELTGISGIQLEALRECKNLGCKQRNELKVKAAVSEQDGLSVLELCHISGLEAGNLRKFPFQDRLFGLPDIKGLRMVIDPGEGETSAPRIDSFRVGVGKFGSYPNNNCGSGTPALDLF